MHLCLLSHVLHGFEYVDADTIHILPAPTGVTTITFGVPAVGELTSIDDVSVVNETYLYAFEYARSSLNLRTCNMSQALVQPNWTRAILHAIDVGLFRLANQGTAVL